MRCESNGPVPNVEDNKLRFEHDVSQYLNFYARVGLHRAKATYEKVSQRTQMNVEEGDIDLLLPPTCAKVMRLPGMVPM